jgi:hypothetical protein
VGGKRAVDFFENDNWLDLDMFQSGHSRLAKEYEYVLNSNKSTVKRPIINGEARYENIPDRFWENKYYGWLDDADVRVSAYWSILAGAAGYTYGCHDIWQMYTMKRQPMIQARTGWQQSLELPGSTQMKYMKELFGVLPWQTLELDQSLILNDNPEDEAYIIASISKSNDLILAYAPTGRSVKIDLTKIKAEKLNAFWFNPRSGKIVMIGEFETRIHREFKPWSQGWGSDFLLILTAKDAPYDFLKFY